MPSLSLQWTRRLVLSKLCAPSAHSLRGVTEVSYRRTGSRSSSPPRSLSPPRSSSPPPSSVLMAAQQLLELSAATRRTVAAASGGTRQSPREEEAEEEVKKPRLPLVNGFVRPHSLKKEYRMMNGGGSPGVATLCVVDEEQRHEGTGSLEGEEEGTQAWEEEGAMDVDLECRVENSALVSVVSPTPPSTSPRPQSPGKWREVALMSDIPAPRYPLVTAAPPSTSPQPQSPGKWQDPLPRSPGNLERDWSMEMWDAGDGMWLVWVWLSCVDIGLWNIHAAGQFC